MKIFDKKRKNHRAEPARNEALPKFFRAAKLLPVFIAVLILFSVNGISPVQGQLPPPPPPPPPPGPPPPPPPPGPSIIYTKHNLSMSGPGTIKSATEDQICFFCHTPHRARRDVPPLWNRNDSMATYIPYQSSTLYASVGQPTGASKLCLSCHDGTVALGALLSSPVEIAFIGGIRFLPEGPSKLGTDLSDDHPVSFVYNSGLALSNGELNDPAALPEEIQLDDNSQLQCTSCHDPHSDLYGKFLVMPNNQSMLCNACHKEDGWIITSHATSSAIWNGIGMNPWPHTTYTTVSENGCENCHKPHTAGRHERLLNYAFEEDNCLSCHNGNVAVKDIAQELTKPFRHGVQDYTGIHDAAEDFSGTGVQTHVECSDCHNPHWSNSSISPGAPLVSGRNEGVSGINSAGLQVVPALNEYEICYKCHADNNVISFIDIDRQLQMFNTRLEFDPSNPSYHPVEVAGINPNVPSLLPPYTTSSIIYCTDCHNNDNSTGPAGPHGSYNQYLLEANYSTNDFTSESTFSYALCYNCHDRNSIIGDASFSEHSKHIVENNTPCSACHDPHGISSTQGNPINNSHLINFDVTIVFPSDQGALRFDDLGTFSGSCSLKCHGRNHNAELYP
jgi:predicted CXXCH cytochrome family protein